MPLRTLVKVASLTNLSDARYCAGMNVNLLGFQTIPSRAGHITPVRFQEIRGWISGPGIVAEAHGVGSREELAAIFEAYRPDYIELGLADLKYAGEVPVPLIIALKPGELLPPAAGNIAYAIGLYDPDRTIGVPLIIPVSSVEETVSALALAHVAGIALQGSDELSPGLKSYDNLAPILEMLDDEN